MLGERLTAVMMDQFSARLPGAKTFPALPWPGVVNGDVDHALLVGDRVAFLDGKLRRAGHYTADAHGHLLRDGRPSSGGTLHFPAAVQAWRNRLPAGVEAGGFLVVHPATPGRVTFDIPAGYPIVICAAEEFAQVVGGWLAGEAGRVNRPAFERLLGR